MDIRNPYTHHALKVHPHQDLGWLFKKASAGMDLYKATITDPYDYAAAHIKDPDKAMKFIELAEGGDDGHGDVWSFTWEGKKAHVLNVGRTGVFHVGGAVVTDCGKLVCVEAEEKKET